MSDTYYDAERLKIATQGLRAIIEESAELSPAKKIAEQTLEEITKHILSRTRGRVFSIVTP